MRGDDHMNEKEINLTEDDVQNLIIFLNRVQFTGIQEAGVITILVQKLTKPPAPKDIAKEE